MADIFEGSQQAQLAVGGGLGSALRVYIKHPGTLVKSAAMLVLGIGSASIFGTTVQPLIGWNLPATGALIGLLGVGVAEGVVRAVDAFDYGKLLGKAK